MKESRYRQMVIALRTSLENEKTCDYFVHTTIGPINVVDWQYQLEGFVIVRGEDEDGKLRFLVFSEEEMCKFPFEVRRKGKGLSKEIPGFKPTTES
jgi:hypothetical protein